MSTARPHPLGPVSARWARRPGARRTLAVLAPVLAFLALTAWGISSPVGSSPDDDFHVTSLWCEPGDRDGICEDTEDPASRVVAFSLIGAPTCYAFRPAESGACVGQDLSTFADDEMVRTERGNFDGLYPRVFYAALSPFAGPDLEAGVLAIRTVNAALFVLVVTAVVVAVPPALRRPVVVGVVATAVPLGMFVIPSTNPSSWALLCAATLWATVLGFLRSRGRRAAVLAALSVVVVVMGAGARADAAIFAVLALLAVGVLAARRGRPRVVALVLPAVVAVVAFALFSTASQGGQVATGLPNEARPDRSSGRLLFVNLLEAPRLWSGMLGEKGIGWLDTELPASTWVLAVAVFFALLFWGVAVVDRRKALAVVGVFAALWLVPVVLLVQTGAVVGEHVQPRYVLPMAIILAGLAALPVGGRAPRLTGLQAWAVVGALGVANAVALYTNTRRYVTGTDVTARSLDVAVEWWWPVAPSPMTSWVLGSLAFVGALAALAVLDRLPDRPAADPGAEPGQREVPDNVAPERVAD